jgi:hypothetical protein
VAYDDPETPGIDAGGAPGTGVLGVIGLESGAGTVAAGEDEGCIELLARTV